MDHHVPSAITAGVRRRGVDVRTALEDEAALFDDNALLARATLLGRVLFSQDEDLLAIAHQWLLAGRDFAGVAYAHQLSISIGQAVRDLEFQMPWTLSTCKTGLNIFHILSCIPFRHSRVAFPCATRAACSVLCISITIVIGPTPLGTGVIIPATSLTASKSTSPASLPSGRRLMPTSTTTAPGRTISALTKRG